MPYTFGAGAGDDVNWSIDLTALATDRSILVAGWWLPTTLTAARGLWSAGNTIGAEIDTTTDELRLKTDNTTDGEWTTAGVDLVTNEWRFLAFLGTANNTTGAAWRVWAGGLETAPQEATVTVAVARSGNFTGNATFYLGNKGTGTAAFQGDIGPVWVVNSGASGASSALGLAAHGAISNDEADFVYRRFVLPMWLGDPSGYTHSPTNSSTLQDLHPMDALGGSALGVVYRRSDRGLQPFIGWGLSGPTLSQNREPRPRPVMPFGSQFIGCRRR